LLDARHLWLPDPLTVPLCLTGLASAAVLPALALPERLVGAAYSEMKVAERLCNTELEELRVAKEELAALG
jgi:hypothetical protein